MYAAVSIDGFIATNDGDSDWVLDDELFEKIVNEHGCIALGCTTFSLYLDDH